MKTGSNNKVHAQGCWYDTDYLRPLFDVTGKDLNRKAVNKWNLNRYVYFASKHEMRAYETLHNAFPGRVITQYPVLIIPKSICYPSGKYWRVDFAVWTKGNFAKTPDMIVEAKGYVFSDFELTLVLLEANQRELFEKLNIVFPDKPPLSKTLFANLHHSNTCSLFSLKQFKAYLKGVKSN